jgi:hypothetical protein
MDAMTSVSYDQSGGAQAGPEGRHRAQREDIEREAARALDAFRTRARRPDEAGPVLLEHVEQHQTRRGVFRKAQVDETHTTLGRGWMIGDYAATTSVEEPDQQANAGHRIEVFLLEDGSYATREADTPIVEGPFVECPGWSTGADFWVQVRDRCTDPDRTHHRH